MPQEAGNDFRLADWRMDLLEELFAESENALGLRCPAAVVIAQFIGGSLRLHSEDRPLSKKSNTSTICLRNLN